MAIRFFLAKYFLLSERKMERLSITGFLQLAKPPTVKMAGGFSYPNLAVAGVKQPTSGDATPVNKA